MDLLIFPGNQLQAANKSRKLTFHKPYPQMKLRRSQASEIMKPLSILYVSYTLKTMVGEFTAHENEGPKVWATARHSEGRYCKNFLTHSFANALQPQPVHLNTLLCLVSHCQLCQIVCLVDFLNEQQILLATIKQAIYSAKICFCKPLGQLQITNVQKSCPDNK